MLAVSNPRSQIAEENVYAPYGQLTARRLTAFGDGDTDSGDLAAWDATQPPSADCLFSPAIYKRGN